MKQITDKDQLRHQTILDVKFEGEYLVLIFSSDTFAIFYSDRGYEAGDQSIEFELQPTEDDFLLRNAGIITEKEFKQRRKKWEDEIQAKEEEREKLTYQKLRAKYGS